MLEIRVALIERIVDLSLRFWRKPPIRRFLIHKFEGNGAFKHVVVVVENILHLLIYCCMSEKVSAILALHKLKEDGIDRKSNHNRKFPGRWGVEGFVDQIEHILPRFVLQSIGALGDSILPVEPENRVFVNKTVQVVNWFFPIFFGNKRVQINEISL